jgi:AcrR family transcriptional regulator
MNNKRRTQPERSAETRRALIAAARDLFGERGYAGVGTEEIVHTADLTRGALYHHFHDKSELFAAVFEGAEVTTNDRIREAVAESGSDADPIEAMRQGAAAFLDVCAEPQLARIMIIDAPGVLGWERWTEISNRHNMGLVHALIAQGIELGRIPSQPVAPLAHILVGALREAALYLVRAENRRAARVEVGAVMDRLIEAIAAG